MNGTVMTNYGAIKRFLASLQSFLGSSEVSVSYAGMHASVAKWNSPYLARRRVVASWAPNRGDVIVASTPKYKFCVVLDEDDVEWNLLNFVLEEKHLLREGLSVLAVWEKLGAHKSLVRPIIEFMKEIGFGDIYVPDYVIVYNLVPELRWLGGRGYYIAYDSLAGEREVVVGNYIYREDNDFILAVENFGEIPRTELGAFDCVRLVYFYISRKRLHEEEKRFLGRIAMVDGKEAVCHGLIVKKSDSVVALSFDWKKEIVLPEGLYVLGTFVD